MKVLILSIFVLLLTSCSIAEAQEVNTFEWDAVTTSIDGLPLTETVAYRVYCDPDPMMDVGEVITVPINITGVDGTYNCTMTAYTVLAGSESPRSAVVTVIKQAGKYYTGGTLNAPVLRVR